MRHSHVHRFVLALGCVALLVGGWFVVSGGLVAGGERRDALARWEAHEPAAYAFVYGYCSGMCASCPLRVTVRDNVVVEAVLVEVDSDDGCSAPEKRSAPTIEDVFEIAEEHQPHLFNDTTITYDDEWGFPTSIEVRCGEGTADCGSGWSVRDFAVLS